MTYNGWPNRETWLVNNRFSCDRLAKAGSITGGRRIRAERPII